MKKISVFFAFFAAMAVISACNKDIETVQQPAKEMTISVSIPDDGLTKVALEQDATDPDGVIKLAWEATDVITVKNAADESKAVVFSLKDGEGTKSATFTSTDASALDGATAFDIYLTSNLPDDCSEQTQAANGSTSHLGYYATLRGVNKFDGVTFSQAWATANGEGTFASSAYLRIRAKMPSAAIAAAVQKVTLKASAEILAGSDEMEITITKPGSDDDIVTVYATLTPESVAVAEGTGLMVQFQVSSDAADKYTAYRELSTMTIAAGKVNAMNINCVNVDKFANDSDVNIGKEANPYLIGDRHQMVAMHDHVVADEIKYFALVDDVDMKGIAWTSLNGADPYSIGIDFNGGSHTISNFSCNYADCDYPSFAGILRGSIYDVTFDGAAIECNDKKGGVVGGYIGHKKKGYKSNCTNVVIKNSNVNSAALVGGLAAQGDNLGTVKNCSIIKTTVSTTSGRAGSLIGSIVAFDELSDCYAEDVSVSAVYYSGGLIGVLNGGGTVIRCYSTGTVSSSHTSYARSGGLIGWIENGNVKDSYSTCTVDVKGQWGGGLAGEITVGSVTKCYYNGTVSSLNHYTGGLIGHLLSEKNKDVITVNGVATIDKCYFDGTINLPTGSTGKAQAGGIISYMDEGTSATISNCYTSGSWAGRRWFGGIVGGTVSSAGPLSITNCYTTASITGTPFGAAVGAQNIPTASITCTGLIAWWPSGNLKATGNDITSSSCYIGQDGTISAKATELGWDSSIWDLTGSVPTLK